jgi:hypothetical protein
VVKASAEDVQTFSHNPVHVALDRMLYQSPGARISDERRNDVSAARQQQAGTFFLHEKTSVEAGGASASTELTKAFARRTRSSSIMAAHFR